MSDVPYVKVLVTGDRNWTDEDLLAQALSAIGHLHPSNVMVVHGGAAGADSLAGKVANRLGMATHVYEAEWDRYGRAAGPKRNQTMISENPDISLALVVHDNLANSRGTADCLRRILKAKIPVRYITHAKEKK